MCGCDSAFLNSVCVLWFLFVFFFGVRVVVLFIGRGVLLFVFFLSGVCVTICACEHTVVLIVRSALHSRRIVGTVFRQSENFMLKKHSLPFIRL